MFFNSNFFKAIVYVLTGMYGDPSDIGAGVCLLIIIQVRRELSWLVRALLASLLGLFTKTPFCSSLWLV